MIMVYVCPQGHQNFQKVKVQKAGCLSHGPTIICKTCFEKASYDDQIQVAFDDIVLATLQEMGEVKDEKSLPPDPERIM